MQTPNHNSVLALVKRNWFQLTLVGLVLLVLTRKEFSFQFNINNPDQIEETTPTKAKSQSKKSELLTERKASTGVAHSEANLLNSLPFIGGGSTKPKSELPQVPRATVEAYIKRFAHVAISERKKYGLPASIILANALYHSFAGQSELSRQANNHFGIPCTNDWIGSKRELRGHCYRQYENAWTSFRDHSLYVTSGRFSNLRQYSTSDFKNWARGLEKMEYSELPDLADQLIEIIETYQLQQLDLQ